MFEQLLNFVEPTTVILAKCNIEESLVPFDIYQLPTIKLFPGPATDKRYPVDYFDDPRSLKGYLRFLRQEDGTFVRRIAS